jgi:transcriptional regulator with PAS, ATPase and Fis domain
LGGRAINSRKKVGFIGHTEATCNYIEHQLTGFLGQYVDVASWCISRMQVPPPGFTSADMFVCSNQTVLDAVSKRLPPGKPVLKSARIISPANLGNLFDLDPTSRVLVVGTAEETVDNTIQALNNLGFRHFEYFRYYPGSLEATPEDVEIAITSGLAYLVPRHIKKIIDLGGKGLDLSTFAEIMNHLDIPLTPLNDVSHFYLEAIVNNTLKIRNIGKVNEALKQRLEVILDTVDEAIVAVDRTSSIMLFNPTAEKLLNTTVSEAIGRDIAAVIPGFDFQECLKTGAGFRHRVVKIQDSYHVVNANVIPGADDGILGVVAIFRPVDEVQELETRVRGALRKKGNTAKYTFGDIVGRSEELAKTISLARKFAQTDLTILLEGESGTGKELFAQSIHNASLRRKRSFVAVNFAAIPESLIESELFGYDEGAFTGAKKGGKPGLFEEAHTGTMFLDEIGSASLEVQKRLLRVLEEREVRRVGSGFVVPVDVRIIAASNQKFAEMVSKGTFRYDLFYRLCTLPINIPPLRQRAGDILHLVDHFAEKYYCRKLYLSSELADFLENYAWPGNIREMQNTVRYLCSLIAHGQKAQIENLPQYLIGNDDIPDERFSPPSRRWENNDNLDPMAADMAHTLLAEIAQATLDGGGIGWLGLLRRLEGKPGVSENIIKRWLKKLNNLGYTETGTTRQGTRITPKGKEFLDNRVH